jgi:hypothetical protein
MRRGIGVLGLVILIAGVLLAAGSAQAESGVCASRLPGTLVVHHVRCVRAEKVIHRFAAKAQEEGPVVRVLGFHCDARRPAGFPPGKEPPIRCKRGRQHIRYSGGF